MKNQRYNFEPEVLKVLVVDDHPQMRKAVAKALSKLGFQEILETGSGADAIKMLQSQIVDLVVCDLYLLDVSGFDVLEYIRNREVDSDIPVLVVTGEASKEDIVKAADTGADDYLLKPFKYEDLTKKIEKLATAYQNPSPAIKLRRKAERYYFEKRYDEAMDVVQDCMKVDPESVYIRHLLALLLLRQGKSSEAMQILNRNIQLNENYYRSYALLADIHLKLENPSEAIDLILRELELNSKQPRRQAQVANLLLEAGRVEEAMHHFRHTLQENVKHKKALFGMGRAYAELDNIDKSIYYFRKLRRYFPTNTQALEAIAKVCLKAGEAKKAEYALRDEKAAYKNRLDTYLVLAKFYLATDEKEKALGVLEELLQLSPENITALKLKAATQMRFGEHTEAIATYRKIVQLDKTTSTWIQFADVYIHCKQYLSAINILHKLYKRKDHISEVHARLMAAYAHSHQFAKASILFAAISKSNNVSPKLAPLATQAENSLKLRRIRAHKAVAS